MVNYDFRKMSQLVPLKNRMVDDGYFVWCGSVIKHGGKYHMYYSRWEKKHGFTAGWVSHSEVAHAVANNIEGPYKFENVVLGKRERHFWDGTTAHNPYMLQYEGKFYLYYMGTTALNHITDAPKPYSGDWFEYRNRQRIGVAVSESPEGPFERFNEPVLDKNPKAGTWDSLMVSNPSITASTDGNILMLYKGVMDNTEGDLSKGGGPVKAGVAMAKSPTGPFIRKAADVFKNPKDPEDNRFLTEDSFIWYAHGKYRAFGSDLQGVYTDNKGGIAQFESTDGVTDWEVSKYPLVQKRTFFWEDGTESVGRMERPWLLFENEEPAMLFGAVRLDKEESDTTNVFMPLK